MASSTLGPTSRAALPLPDGQLDQLGVEQGQPHRRVEGAHGDQELEDVGLAGARLAAQEQVALGQGDGDLAAVLVLTDRDGLPQRQPPGSTSGQGVGVGSARGSRRRTTTRAWRALAGSRTTRTSRTAEEGGDAFGLGLQVGHLAAGRDPDPELLAGPGEPAAGDPGMRSLGVASSAWRQASAHRRRRWDRNRAWASGSRVQVTMATTRAAATISRSGPSRPSRSPSHR